MIHDFTIEDFERATYADLARFNEIFEVAKVMSETMKGNIFIDIAKINFKPLKIDGFEMKAFNRLRGVSTPKLKDTKLGKMLVWDLYAIRIKK